MQITIKHNFPDVQRKLDALEKQARYATVVALTRTAQDVKEEQIKQLQRSLDRPTPYSLNSMYVKWATKEKMEARVWIKDDRNTNKAGTPAVNYLNPHVEGGARHQKRFEKALQAAGHLPSGWMVVPGQGATIDAFGNLSRGQIIQVLSQLRITQTAGYTRNMSFEARKQIAAQRKAGGRFFVVKPGKGLQPGVYQRELVGKNITPIMIFVKSTAYKKRLPFYEVGRRVIDTRFRVHFKAEFKEALRTARWDGK